jgi:peptidyl-prolyl cis-trans isomerase B (cyclophilin B)
MKKLILQIALCFSGISLIYAQPSFTGKPQYNILTIQNGDTIGTTKVELFPSIAPLHVANFDSLVNVHFFDSTAFHRVIPGFMIQGGDPNSRHGPISTWGYGDPNQPTVNAEFSAAKHVRGTLSAARDADTNSANSQFFICVAAAAWLNGDYSVYGRVVSGMNFVDTIVNAPRDSNDNPLQKIEMFITYAGSNDTMPSAPTLTTPAIGSFAASTSRILKWNAQADGIIYTAQVATDSNFTNIVKTANLGTNQFNVTGLSPLTKYYWRVKTNNGGHFSQFSEVWNFYVSAVGVNEMVNALKHITVYPNPSNAIFEFDHLETGSTITILNLEGKPIITETACFNKLSINLNNHAKGVYFYIHKTNDGIETRGKLVVF